MSRFQIEAIVAVLVLVALIIAALRISRRLNARSLRARVAIGILFTGGIAVGFLAFYAFNSATQIINSLSDRFEANALHLTEEQLVASINAEADKADRVFEKAEDNVIELAAQWSMLIAEQEKLGVGSYWNAENALTQLKDGQYGNSIQDASSAYVPPNIAIDAKTIDGLNASAYLDFSAPFTLEANPQLLAVYAIDTRGITRYYPNINLAAVVPPGFNPSERPYFRITSPSYNPSRTPRWAIPYIDATGAGLVVTIAAPVYNRDLFQGIVAADMKLTAITEQIEQIKVGQSGYAFMLNDAGGIISMPQAGFDLFGINPQAINPDEYYKLTVFGKGSLDVRRVVNRMAAGGHGLITIPVDGVETYFAFAPIKTTGYSIGVIVPVAEMQSALIASKAETTAQIQSATLLAAIILTALLLAAIAISLRISERIATPIVRLTETANQIVAGDLAAQATATSKDEIGALANAFNTMTNRLRETLGSLEQRVVERTSELTFANEQSQQRAAQLETIARVAHAVGSTRDLSALLPQVADAISKQFNFYHVGIFLLDSRKEYAVLSASNSEGGKKMLANRHRLKVGETGIVGHATGTGKARVALDVGADAVFFDNPFLPETRSEIALPLRDSNGVIGALDVQSKAPNAFGEQDINTLEILADQMSLAIQNASQYEETRKALAESETLSRELTRAGWSEFAKRKLLGIRHSGARSTILYANRKGDDTEASRNETVLGSRESSISIPLKLRDEVIGSVDVRAAGNRRWDQDEMDIVNAIVERAAFALENARFLEESQKRAAKERVIGEIASKISAKNTAEELIKTAALELSRSLPGAKVTIQFKEGQESE